MSLPRGFALRVVPVAVAFVVLACSGLKRADDPADAGEDEGGTSNEEASTGEDGGAGETDATTDASVADAGPVPTDFECNGDPWTKTAKTKNECAPRQVKVVAADAPADVTGVSIARTPAGRVGIVYNSEVFADEGQMHLAHFTPTTPTYAAPKIVKRATGLGFHDGYQTKIAASAPDTLAVLSFDSDDTQGEVHLRKLVGGVEPLTDELAFAAVKMPTELGFASDAAGNVYATVRVQGTTTAKIVSKQRSATGTLGFTPLMPDLSPALVRGNAPGAGSASIFVDPGNQVHLLLHHNDAISPQHSNPRYHVLAGATWSDRKTVDNGIIDGLSGFSPRIAVFGARKYAAYYFRKAAQTTPPTADLRLATWTAAMDTPQIEILDQQIPSPDALFPAYRVAMAVDKFGLVHLAMLRPSPNNNVGVLEYRRQTPVAGGGTKWLVDIVDPDVLSELSSAFLDMVVDDKARPHIAYRSGKDGKVRYATRFDR